MSKLDDLVKEINKEWKENIAAKGIPHVEINQIPFTSSRLNYMTYGGVPRNRLIEFSGDEGSGKTTSALDLCKNAQILFEEEFEEEMSNADATRKKYLENRGPKKVVYADCENTLDEDWARLLGVDFDSMYLIKPQTQAAEDIFQIVLDMIETDEVGLVVIDSLGVMMSKQAYEKDIEEKTYGGISMPLTRFSEKAVMHCRKYNCTVLCLNQMRDDMNSTYGGKITTGGRAWKHNCTLRIQFAKGEFLDENGKPLTRSAESPSGNKVMVSIIKTKTFKPNRRTGFYTLMYDYGIDEVTDLVETAMKYGIVNKAGAWFTIVDVATGEVVCDEDGNPMKFQGQANLTDYIRENEALLKELKDQIKYQMEEGNE